MQLNTSKKDLQASIGTGESYRMATLILIFFIIVCAAVIVERQVEVNNCWSTHGECRNKIENLAELKGKFEEKTNHAVTLKEQTDQILKRTFLKEDKALEGKEDCEKRLRDIETATRHILNVTLLAGENQDKIAVKYNLCVEKLAECQASKTSS